MNVLVIDMDPQGNASTALGAKHNSGDPSVYDVIEGRAGIADVMQTCPEFPTLQVVPASIDLSGAELEISDLPNRNDLLDEALDKFLDESEIHYDYVFVDCAPSFGETVITYDPRGLGAISYREAAYEINERSQIVLETIASRRNEN